MGGEYFVWIGYAGINLDSRNRNGDFWPVKAACNGCFYGQGYSRISIIRERTSFGVGAKGYRCRTSGRNKKSIDKAPRERIVKKLN